MIAKEDLGDSSKNDFEIVYTNIIEFPSELQFL